MKRVVTYRVIHREELQKNRDRLYVYGDNVQHRGMGGQAREMRGEPNSFGFPTKWAPSMEPGAFFQDDCVNDVNCVDNALRQLEEASTKYREVVIPAYIGCGLAQMPSRCPKLYKHLQVRLGIVKENES